MEILLGSIILIPFLWLNYNIIKTDLNEKRIPNNYLIKLLYLIPFVYSYFYFYGYFNELHALVFFMQTIVTFIVSFLLFRFNIWGAGDAKYLLVLSLFIPQIGIIHLIFSIAIITLLYLFLYFLWFWFGPNLWIKKRRTALYHNLWKTKKDTFLLNNNYKQITSILVGFNIFIIVFVCLRFIRLDIFLYIQKEHNVSISLIFQEKYGLYMFLGLIAAFIFFAFILKKILLLIRKFIGKKSSFLYLIMVNIFGFGFLTYEYIKSPNQFTQTIFLILTLYLLIFLIFKIILFAYKLVFIVNEETLVHIDNLQEGMVIDKNKLYDKMKKQSCIKNNIPDLDIYIKESINHSLQKKDIQKISKLHKKIVTHHKKNKSEGFIANPYVSITRVFSFSPNIFIGFVFLLIYFSRNIIFT